MMEGPLLVGTSWQKMVKIQDSYDEEWRAFESKNLVMDAWTVQTVWYSTVFKIRLVWEIIYESFL